MSAEPLRHYFVGDPDSRRACARTGCARPASDPVHLTPGDDAAWNDAVHASTAGHDSRPASPAHRDRAAKRHAARWTFSTTITTASDAGGSATFDLDPARG